MATAKKKVSAASVIRDGIKAGKSVKQILSLVTKKCEGSNADESHIRHYANKLLAAGEIKKADAEKYGAGGTRGRPARAKESTKAAAKKPAKKTVKKAADKKVSKPAKKAAKPSKKSEQKDAPKKKVKRKVKSKE